MATTVISRMKIGKARNTSVMRMITLSTQPPKKPATSPTSAPSTTVISVATRLTSSDTRAP